MGPQQRKRPGDDDEGEGLVDADWTSEENVQRDILEVRRIRANLAVLLLCAVLDVVAALYSASKDGADAAFSFKNFDLTQDLADVMLFVSIRSLVMLLVAVASQLGPAYAWSASVGYWTSYSALVYAIGKLIAFDWSASGGRVYIGLFTWIAFGVAEMVILKRLEYWLLERGRWTVRPTSEGVAVDQETGNAAGSGNSVSTSINANDDEDQDSMRRAAVPLLGNHGGQIERVKRVHPSQLHKPDGAEDKLPPSQLSNAGLMRVMKPYFWPRGFMNKLRCLLTWVFLGLSKACNLASPLYIGKAVQELSEAGTTEGTVFFHIVMFSGLTLGSKLLKEMQNVVYLKVKQTAYVEVAEETFTHLHALSLEWHLKKRMGNVLRSMDRGVSAANTLVTYLFLYLLPSVAECVVVFVIFYSHFDIPTVSATAFISFVAYSTLTVQITLWRKKFREKTNLHDNEVSARASDSLINYETVKYFTAEKYEIGRYTESIFNFQKYSVNTSYSLSFLNSTQNTIIQVCTAVSLCMAAHEVLTGSGRLTIGSFVSISSYIGNLFAPLSFLGSVYNAVIQALVDMTNLSELLAEEPDLTDAPNARSLVAVPSGRAGAAVEFRNVSFHYPTQPPNSGLHAVSFTIAPGTTTAIVGSTGSGKSTLARLLFRFYDPLEGQVLISDQDIKLVTQHSLRKAIGVVPQDTVLFNDTIIHNIRYGNQDATYEQIVEASKSAQIYEFIMSLPKGFDTMVGERGLKLSGGEKQRVSIARCLLKDPPIVVLDEATSALDNVTERSVQAALNNLTESTTSATKAARTTLVIAHRLSTIQTAEQIVVLEKGQLLEKGTHQELLDKGEAYANLWHSRLEQELEMRAKAQQEMTEE
ncbi:ABC transporter ATP-binding protein [Hondaea fermentalgiana]|uniref:ABC transporter ATP-binding protein n=1 Tax=Hondaea fermentalgiana TaxID=2315210 RepID=A0A2R5G0X4_9STRA|nr:ABC transporter ATP-binding protein [Hondaea fermentalgiana]|eukprot:GBG24175.1 ABC transporter ATP-binding protein [Hondaea fermentalgiana]